MNRAQKQPRITCRCHKCGALVTHPSREDFNVPNYPDRTLHRSMFCFEWTPKSEGQNGLRSSWMTCKSAQETYKTWKDFYVKAGTGLTFKQTIKIIIHPSLLIPLP